MKKLISKAIITCFIINLFIVILWAQSPYPETTNKNLMMTLTPKIKIGLEYEYNTNLFGLTDDQIAKYNEHDPRDSISARFQHMDNLSDYIFSPWIELNYEFPSPFGGTLEISPQFQYSVFKKNPESHYASGSLSLLHSIGDRGRVEFEESVVWGFFHKNYLSGTNNTGNSDNVSRYERIYSAAKYNEYESELSYENQLLYFAKEKWEEPGLVMKVSVGNCLRNYNHTFENRNRNVWFESLRMKLQPHQRYWISATYQYEEMLSPQKKELILIDETLEGVNQDISGDGSLSDNAEFITEIDRSQYHHIFSCKACYDPFENCSFFADAEIRKLFYRTDDPLDIERFHQDETRQEYKFGFDWKFLKSCKAELEYSFTKDKSNEGDCIEKAFVSSISFKF